MISESIIVHDCDVRNCAHLRSDYDYVDSEGILHQNIKDLCIKDSKQSRCSDIDNCNCPYKQHQRDLYKIRKYLDCMNEITSAIQPYITSTMGLNEYGEFDVVLAVKEVLSHMRTQEELKSAEFYKSIIEDIKEYSSNELDNYFNHCAHSKSCVNPCGVGKETYLKEVIKRCELMNEERTQDDFNVGESKI